MVNRIYPPELQLHKTNTSVPKPRLSGFAFIYFKWIVLYKIYDKRDDFDFDIVKFPFLDGVVPRSSSYGVYISQLIRFASVSSHVADFYARNESLAAEIVMFMQCLKCDDDLCMIVWSQHISD